MPDSYLGSALVLARRLPEGKAAFEDAAKKSPNYAFAHYNLALLTAVEGDVSGAIDRLDRALAIDGNLAEAHLLRGRLLIAKKDVPGAVAALERATQLQPENAEGWKHLAVAYDASGDAARAAETRCKANALGADVPCAN